jgi:hypothetical protein
MPIAWPVDQRAVVGKAEVMEVVAKVEVVEDVAEVVGAAVVVVPAAGET